jgi:putative oxidoreductase
VLTLGGIALLFTGAGRLSLDSRLWGRDRPPHAGGAPRPSVAFGLLLIAILVAVVTWVALNGTNPIHFSTPPS